MVFDIVAIITGPDGAFRFRTIVPALYSGRMRHYRVKVQAPGSRLLTTQLYFPDEPANLRDGLFQSKLLMRVADAGDSLAGRFDFVLRSVRTCANHSTFSANCGKLSCQTF